MAESKKTVLITGSTRGIGLAFAELYKAQGWNVIGAARNLETAGKLRAVAPYKIVQLDASDEASILKAAEELKDEVIDLLINNAGIGERDTTETATKEGIVRQFEVNAVGPFLVTRAFLPNLRAAVAKSGSAKVGQVSSIMGSITENGSGGLYGYRASKTALNMINASLAIDLKKENITSVSLHPGYVSTDMTSHSGVVQPADSVAGLAKVLADATPEDAGKFFDFEGKNRPW